MPSDGIRTVLKYYILVITVPLQPPRTLFATPLDLITPFFFGVPPFFVDSVRCIIRLWSSLLGAVIFYAWVTGWRRIS
jgi:hypothetical protein